MNFIVSLADFCLQFRPSTIHRDVPYTNTFLLTFMKCIEYLARAANLLTQWNHIFDVSLMWLPLYEIFINKFLNRKETYSQGGFKWNDVHNNSSTQKKIALSYLCCPSFDCSYC